MKYTSQVLVHSSHVLKFVKVKNESRICEYTTLENTEYVAAQRDKEQQQNSSFRSSVVMVSLELVLSDSEVLVGVAEEVGFEGLALDLSTPVVSDFLIRARLGHKITPAIKL